MMSTWSAHFDDGFSALDLVAIERTLEEMLRGEIDLVQHGTPKARVQWRVERDLVRAF